MTDTGLVIPFPTQARKPPLLACSAIAGAVRAWAEQIRADRAALAEATPGSRSAEKIAQRLRAAVRQQEDLHSCIWAVPVSRFEDLPLLALVAAQLLPPDRLDQPREDFAEPSEYALVRLVVGALQLGLQTRA